jgi:hypothetical protein
MGILRTDKISGLETPTAVTGSVLFDGTNDDLQIADSDDFTFAKNDFTIEFWRYKQVIAIDTYVAKYGGSANTDRTFWCGQGTDGVEQFYWYSGSSVYSISSKSFPINTWAHFAAVRYNGTMTLYIDGVEAASTTTNVDVTLNDTSEVLRVGGENTGTYDYQGYISNLRILNGTALYTSEFTPPVHELEVIGDTVLLCCNNSDSAGAEATGKSITVNNNAAASTFSPGLIRDFTFGTEFRGVTTFDTQGYFVPPSGTTEQRGRGRGLVGGGDITPASESESIHIDYITISSTGNSQDFGDLSDGKLRLGASGSSTRGIFAGGKTPSLVNVMEFVTIAATGNVVDFGDLANPRDELGGAGNNIRALFFTGSAPSTTNVIEYVTTAALGNAQDFGDLTRAEVEGCGCGSPTRGILFIRDNSIDYVTWATTGNAQDFGDTAFGENGDNSAASDSTRAIIAGGVQGPANAANGIHYLTISTLGNTQEFGDLTATAREGSGMSNSIRGVFSLGIAGGSQSNAMDYITIATSGDAKDFGDLTPGKIKEGSACSDSHGAIE